MRQILLLTLLAVLLVGCDKDRNKGKGGCKPPAGEVHRVPDVYHTAGLLALGLTVIAVVGGRQLRKS